MLVMRHLNAEYAIKCQCVRFWGKAAERADPAEILDVLSVTGGVPRYLEEIDSSLSADENIRRLCFRPKGVLRDDFDEVADKVEKLPKRRGISVKTALVYEGYLAPIVEADGYFDAIVPFRALLGL